MKHEEKKAEEVAKAKSVTPPPAKTETSKAVDTKPNAPAPKADSGDLRSVVSKDILPPAQRLGLKATYAQLWQNASGKKGDPNEKDSAGSPVLEKYYRNWVNAD